MNQVADPRFMLLSVENPTAGARQGLWIHLRGDRPRRSSSLGGSAVGRAKL